MKLYILKKATPEHPKGCLFNLSWERVYKCTNPCHSAYYGVKTVEENPSWFEEIPLIRKPKRGETYFYFDSTRPYPMPKVWANTEKDKLLYQMGNVFCDKLQANRFRSFYKKQVIEFHADYKEQSYKMRFLKEEKSEDN